MEIYNKIKNYFIKLSSTEIFLLTGLVISWLSIGITPEYIVENYHNLLINFFSVKNFHLIRGMLPLMYFFLLFFFVVLKKKNLNINFKITPIFFLIIYFILQINGLFYQKNYINIYYIIQSLNVLTIIYLGNILIKKKPTLYLVSIIFIFFLFLFTFFYFFINYYSNFQSFYGVWGVLFDNKENFINTFLNDVPRVSGISRLAIILFITFYIIFLSKKKLLIKYYLLLILFSISILFLNQEL